MAFDLCQANFSGGRVPLDEPLLGRKGFGRARRWLNAFQRRWQTLYRRSATAQKWLEFTLIPDSQAIIACWYLAIPILMITGIAGYFALPIEPPAWAGPLTAGIILVVLLAIGRSDYGHWLSKLKLSIVGFLIVIIGFSIIQIRTAWVAAPMLQLSGPEEIGPVNVLGRLTSIEPRGSRIRLVVEPTGFQGIADDITSLQGLRRIRLTMPDSYAVPRAGDDISIRAILRAPPGPSYPGGYVFRRDLFYQQIGAVGFSVGKPTTITPAVQAPPWRERVADLRFAISQRITEVLVGETGAVATALITGQRGGISDATLQNIRDAGISHLLAISGLHLGVVAAWLFFCVRVPLAAIPTVALRLPLKKISALAALFGAAVYVVIAGMPTPTMRAFLMVGMGIGA
ncbi:MAG: ComEC/Rec2 family competence protein, partial [Pseudomonadota bacterium]